MPPHSLADQFVTLFDTTPDFLVRAPGRVNLIGAHVDYNDGWVLPAAINRSIWLAAKAIPAPSITVHALDLSEQATFTLVDLDRKIVTTDKPLPDWALYAAGVAWSLQEAGMEVPGCQIVMAGDVPVGAGLSSSAAVEVAYAQALVHIAAWPVDKMRLAQLCKRAENEYVGVNCGLLDQFACLFGEAGHAVLFDCRTLEWETIPLPGDVVIVVADTGTRRTLATSRYNQRREECTEAVRALQTVLPEVSALRDVSLAELKTHRHVIPQPARQRAQHVIEEIARVHAAAEALRGGDIETVGQLMDRSHISARDLYEISGPELNAMWQASHGHPARLGGRLMGAGWAGCLVLLARVRGVEDFVAHTARCYSEATGRTPTLYVVQADTGAQVLSLEGTALT